MGLSQQLWRAVNSAVIPQAESLVRLREAPSAGPEAELPALANLAERAKSALPNVKRDQPPPLDAATLACFNSFDKVFRRIRLTFFFYLLLNATFAILAIGLFVAGGVFVVLGIRDKLDYLKTILGSVAAIAGLAGTLYTNPMKMVFRAAILWSQVSVLCQDYQNKIYACKAGQDLTDNAVLQAAIACVSNHVAAMLTQLGGLAAQYDK